MLVYVSHNIRYRHEFTVQWTALFSTIVVHWTYKSVVECGINLRVIQKCKGYTKMGYTKVQPLKNNR